MVERKTRFYIDFACWIEDGETGDDALKKAREKLKEGAEVTISGIESFPAFKCIECGEWEEDIMGEEEICCECKWRKRNGMETNSG